MQAEIPSLAERLQGSFSKCPAASGRREAQPSTGLAVAWHSQKNHTSPKAALLLLPSHPPIFLCRSHPFNIGTILDSVLSASFLADSIWRTLYASLPRLPAWYLGDSRSTAASTRTLVRYETEKAELASIQHEAGQLCNAIKAIETQLLSLRTRTPTSGTNVTSSLDACKTELHQLDGLLAELATKQGP